jgi:phenylacetate-coenzyme A ligase PaaK-like adenylate-forming protein
MRARGIRVQQLYATADLGLIAYESALPDGTVTEGMILEESLILEIVRPGTGDPVGAGEVGEVLITSLNKDYPLIRFATGDLSAVLAGTSPCGRDYIIPMPLDSEVLPRVAGAVAGAAARTGVASRPLTDLTAYSDAVATRVRLSHEERAHRASAPPEACHGSA